MRALAVLGSIALSLAAPGASEAVVLPGGLHVASQGPRYLVSRFVLEYAEPHPRHPPLASLAARSYALGRAEDGYVGPRRGGRNIWFQLDEMARQAPVPVYASGLRELCEQIVADLNARGLIGVYVAPHPEDIDPATGEDRRPAAASALRLRVHSGRVQDVRTFAADPALDNAERADRPEHRAIAQRSPVGPERSDLLDRRELDEYLARLNRHPGRFVDVVLTPTLEPGRIHLDYIVEEERPWSLYSSFSNTGPEDTEEWRQRFGFTHQQLTGLDDVLRVDYVTDGFDDIHALFATYEGLLPGALGGRRFEGLRWRLGAARTEYSSEVGVAVGLGGGVSGGAATTEIFEGETLGLELGLVQTVHQARNLFVDVGAGVRWMDVDMTNLTQFSTSMPFVIPGLLLRVESLRPRSLRYAHVTLEKSVPGLAGTSHDDFEEFEAVGGRLELDDDWLALRWDAGLRFEPGSARRRHEIELSTQGQYAFDNRLIPQEQGVAGGLYSVRGYPQSVVAGDSVFVGRAEYRHHWPLARVRNASLWSDWDLILKGFFDLGYAVSHDSGSDLPDEGSETLASVGVGIELLLRRNLSLRLDHGIALRDVDHESVESGDGETHLSAVLRY
jgi:hypothetical protein